MNRNHGCLLTALVAVVYSSFCPVTYALELKGIPYRLMEVNGRCCIALDDSQGKAKFVFISDKSFPQHPVVIVRGTIPFDRPERFAMGELGVSATDGEACLALGNNGSRRIWVSKDGREIRRGQNRIRWQGVPIVVAVEDEPFAPMCDCKTTDILEKIADLGRMVPVCKNDFVGATVDCDYQGIIGAMRWLWNSDEAGLAYCLRTTDCEFRVSGSGERGRVLIEIVRGQTVGYKTLYSWEGGWNTMFRVEVGQECLYLLSHKAPFPGGTLTRVDLATGKPVWCEKLRAMNDQDRNTSFNRIYMKRDGEVFWFFGEEEEGRYIEVKNAETGKTVAHRILSGSDRTKSEGRAVSGPNERKLKPENK